MTWEELLDLHERIGTLIDTVKTLVGSGIVDTE